MLQVRSPGHGEQSMKVIDLLRTRTCVNNSRIEVFNTNVALDRHNVIFLELFKVGELANFATCKLEHFA